MPHTIEHATTGRAKCRACGARIARDELRFGERLPNPFGEEGSETTHWYHPVCGAYRRPESFAVALAGFDGELPDHDALAAAAAFGAAHRRVPRIDAVQRAPSGRARCRACQETIDRDEWRIGLVFFEEGMANQAGYIHARCARNYFETARSENDALLARLAHFGQTLTEADVRTLSELLWQPGDPP